MPNYPKRQRKPASKPEDTLEALEAFEEFNTKIAPEIRQLLLKGASDKDLLKKYTPYMAARLISIALADPDNHRALGAIKDVLDRVNGKATDHKKIELYSELNDEQLDALLLTEMEEMDESAEIKQ